MKNTEMKQFYLWVPLIFLMSIMFFITSLDLGTAKFNHFSNDLDYNTNLVQQKKQPPPAPIPICEASDLTLFIMKSLPRNDRFNGFEPLDDENNRYFLLHTFNLTSNNTWIYDIGTDGVFSGDDLNYLLPSSAQSTIYWMKSTSDRVTQAESIYWIEETRQGATFVNDVKSCTLPNCTNQQIWINSFNGKMHKVMEYNYDLYFFAYDTASLKGGIFSCSLVRSDPDWCGRTQSNYIYYLDSNAFELNLISDESTVRMGGISVVHDRGGTFFNVRSQTFISYFDNFIIHPFIKQSSNYFFVAQFNPTFSLLGLDVSQNSFINNGVIAPNITSHIYSVAIEPLSNGYPKVSYLLRTPTGAKLYQKGGLNNPSILIDEIKGRQFNQNSLFVKNKDIYVVSDNNKLLHYSCF